MLTEFPLDLHSGFLTHRGVVRSHNEDSLLSLPESGLWVVADGMGGHEAGEVASGTIVQAESTIGRPDSAADLQQRFLARLLLAHQSIREHSRRLGGVTVGSTVAALLCCEGYFACIWAGDSRVYLRRDGILTQLTTDHTEAQELMRQGILTREQALTWPRKNVITRAIGVFEEPNSEQVSGQVLPGDTFLLCSDGLTEHVTDDEIAAHLTNPIPQACCDSLVTLTLARGARDNVSVIVVRCGPLPQGKQHEYLEDANDDKTVPGMALIGDLHRTNGQGQDGG